MLDFDLPSRDIELRRQRIRDVWNYHRTDHIPVLLHISDNPFGYTMRDELLSAEKQLALRLQSLRRTLELVPDDYIPTFFVNMGCVGIENALGMAMHYGDTPDQTPGVRPPLVDDIRSIYDLKPIDPYHDGILPAFLDRIHYFVEQTGHQVPVTCLDMNGPMAIAMDIIGSEKLMLGMYEYPEDIHYLLNFAMDNILSVTRACVEAVGGVEYLTCTDFCDHWFPEGKKGHVSDDVCAMYRPAMFDEFSIPVNNRVYAEFGPGLLHNCGPNPCAGRYLEHTPAISGADLAYAYSRGDLPLFRKAFAGRGVLYLDMGYESHEKTLEEYRYIIDSLAPDVVAIFSVRIGYDSVASGQCNPGRLYEDLRRMSEEYAARVQWRD
jgi:hypothetical protein